VREGSERVRAGQSGCARMRGWLGEGRLMACMLEFDGAYSCGRFREGILPMWEDSNNCKGGKWTYNEKRDKVVPLT